MLKARRTGASVNAHPGLSATNSQHHQSDLSEVPDFLASYIPTVSLDQANALSISDPSIKSRKECGAEWVQYGAHSAVDMLKYLNHFFKRLRSASDDGRTLRVRLVLVLFWVWIIWWGERSVFQNTVERCRWNTWEQWPSEATPHHLVLIADPQLVDAHTYPDRPWPLLSLTIRYTDRFMKRSFGLVQHYLDPDSTFFLGDLFDGGREWSPPSLAGDARIDKRWRNLGQQYWMKEYRRFGAIFHSQWLRAGARHQRDSGSFRGRKFIASLPGNHDLGLGKGIREPVRHRFHAYFGEGNRLDIIGNHSLVSVDTVSLSAKNQPGGAGADFAMTEEAGKLIWSGTEDFLNQLNATKGRAVRRHLQKLYPESSLAVPLLDHIVYDGDDPMSKTTVLQEPIEATLPSILLTHVPLYRSVGTPCGPLRERYPPSRSAVGQVEALENDERNAIKIHAGEQYQNVLTPAVSKELVELVGDITHVFSGDDHDYCDTMHREYTSSRSGPGIREITVKSTSFAMGIRKPGFLLVSLWNPINKTGQTLGPKGKATIQTHLCLLPDQIGILIRYGLFVAVTMTLVALHAWRLVASPSKVTANGSMPDSPLLPLFSHAKKDEQEAVYTETSTATSTNTAPASTRRATISSRSSTLTRQANIDDASDRSSHTFVPQQNGHQSRNANSRPNGVKAQNKQMAWQEISLTGSSQGRFPGDRSFYVLIARFIIAELKFIVIPAGAWYLALIWLG